MGGFLSTEATIEAIGIMVGGPQDWSILLVDLEKRICNSFDNCVAVLYDLLFIMIGL